MWNTVQSSSLNVPPNIFFKQFFKRYSVKAITATKAKFRPIMVEFTLAK
jgi:hypothetical protein